MADRFDYFVILAEMRTGSNFLEENINAIEGLKCWGEAYNPAFIGKSSKAELAGVTIEERDADPGKLLDAMIARNEGLSGFRYFHDHDPRMRDRIFDDPRCAKVVLTRNPLESYVSRKIASATGQWRLGDMKDAKTAQIHFDKDEFIKMLDAVKGFQLEIQHRLQTSGQSAFYINYQDIQDIDVVNGLARFLGVESEKGSTSKKTKVQNPARLEDKVTNFDQMVSELSGVDHFNLASTPNFEPKRAPQVPGYIAAAQSPLLYQPVQFGPVRAVTDWLAALDSVDVDELIKSFTQKTLRQWKRQHKGHRSFTVISHPVVRLHRVFCERVVARGDGSFPEVHEILRRNHNLALPENDEAAYGLEQHKAAFLQFAHFIKGNLNGQTAMRVDVGWASQSEVIKGFSEFALPDVVIREDDLSLELGHLAQIAGLGDVPAPSTEPDDLPFALRDIYDDEIEQAVRAAYQRDYMIYGFRPYGRSR